ncbi:acyl-[ACP]--phospholipid O-acyltransferase [Fundidesulfovibrio putealis]|uniref:acyl-[ACP]--phospholipid O-acyltransferase n=1 Tax=Fundidesulfovibrio putealis TaxID=270496 RepID=UPI000421312E|nr:acyl-[ACP]--phospholipid O-acyltransferase [Fundidesulfovibrio putealis]
MMTGLSAVLFKRRFWPLFVSQFLGAGNDNVFKNAIAILVIYRLGDQSFVAPEVLVSLASGLFILPFFLFSATAGQIADRYEKSGLIRVVKFAEILIAGLGAWSLMVPSIPGMLGVLFLLGVQATFFGPLKYAILPEQLPPDDLVDGNALIESGTFLAILLGTIAGGLLVLQEGGIAAICTLLIVLAVLGFAASLFLPKARPGNPSVAIRPNILKETMQVLALTRKRRDIFLSVLGISWFWLVGVTYLAQFPAFAKDVLHADEHAVTLMLTVFSVGIGLGSFLCTRLLKGEISARHVPFAALGMTFFAFDLWLTGSGIGQGHTDAAILPLFELLAQFSVWRVLADLLLLAVAGGVYIVPLYTILQARSEESERARIIAANNIVNAAFMVASSLAGAGMLALGFTVSEVFLAVAVATLAVAVYICGLLPDALLKGFFAWLLKCLYRVEIKGLENLKAAGEKAVIVVNHVSFLDAVLMAAFLPHKPTFAINSFIARRWWVRPFLSVVDAYPMDPTNAMSTRGLIHAVQAGRTCVIFPEGRITITGALMKIYAGPGMIADKADAPIVPVRIDGAQYTPFSRLKGKVRRRWFPQITISILPPQRFDIPKELKGRARRQKIGMELYDVMSRMMFETSNNRRTLFEALLDARRTHGSGAPAVEDINRKPLSYGRLIAGALALGRRITQGTQPGEAVGLMLPNANAAAAAFFAAQAYGRVPAMLNYTTGARNALSACEAARIRTVVTSRRFIEQAGLLPLAEALAGSVRLVYLEDVRAGMTVLDKLYGLLAGLFAGRLARRFRRSCDDPAVILFTSGSEGTPKGVVLSHANILTNCRQMTARVALSSSDILFNALPIFHSFGLTGGLLLPVLSGVKTFLYPSPLHYRIVPEMVYDTNATIMFGADTFLAGYARVASPYDFYSVRYVFAGAEKVKEETRRAWMDTFGLRILEGYGATETAPVIAVNTPMHFKAGTVGRILPGIEHRLEPVPGVEEGGRLWVKGANVMLGYLRAERPGLLEPPVDGWYDTGDIVSVDESGYVRILGRAKRFAKIAGEMVPLGKVETEIAALWPGHHHAVVALPDGHKGERLLLVTTNGQATRAEILSHLRARGLAELMAPKSILTVGRMPILGTGKTDYVAVQALAAPSADQPVPTADPAA